MPRTVRKGADQALLLALACGATVEHAAHKAGMGSVKVLVDLQGDVSVPAGVRRRSARDVLEMGLKFREATELEQRLAAVEARLAGVVPIPEGGSADGGSARE